MLEFDFLKDLVGTIEAKYIIDYKETGQGPFNAPTSSSAWHYPAVSKAPERR